MLIVALLIGFNAVRLLLPLASSFSAILLIIVATEILASPVTIMVCLSCGESWSGGFGA